MADATVTGLVLAGGRATRMGGVDKGLQAWRGVALVDHVIARLAPQVAGVLVNANRNVADYAARGWPVVGDADASFSGPLAGVLAGLRAARTPWLAVVPCDVPKVPEDLVARLAAGAGPGGAYVVRDDDDGRERVEPLCCLLPVDRAPVLAQALAEGRRRVEDFLREAGAVAVRFDRASDRPAFANFNVLADLA